MGGDSMYRMGSEGTCIRSVLAKVLEKRQSFLYLTFFHAFCCVFVHFFERFQRNEQIKKFKKSESHFKTHCHCGNKRMFSRKPLNS